MPAFRIALLACLVQSMAADSLWAQNRAATSGNILESVHVSHRDAVSKVIQRPTITARSSEPTLVAHANVYRWMLDHPDRVYLAWTRMNVPCAEIREASPGKFVWTDEHGSEVTWQAVGRFAEGLVWYASGKVKPAALLPMVPVKAVAVMRFPFTPPDARGVSEIRPDVTVFFQSESRAANAILRLLGPAAPKVAEDGAEQLLFFFSGVASFLQKHPEKIDTLLAPKANR